jgi:L-methionine (R)-S-oxide reductase
MLKKSSGGPRHDDRVAPTRRAPAAGGKPQSVAGAAAGAHSQTLKASAYEECFDAIVAIWRDEGGKTLDDIALMATINAVLANRFPQYFWTGFYRVCGDRLVVGPYIGTVGCLQIEFGKGVCGTAAAKCETLIVADVNQFPGHIACDAASKSEIVVPVFGPDRELIAVLDIDSDRFDVFDETDRAGLERIVALFGDDLAATGARRT